YTARNPLRSLALLASGLMSYNSSTTFLAAPSVLQESLTFPYVQGMFFASALHSRGGWQQVNQAYKNLPASSEQILHPEKYFAREAPVKVPFRDLTPKLGPGWKLLDHDVNGEFGLQVILKEHLPAPNEAVEAAAGWAGDRYAIYQGSKGARLIAQVTLWDNKNEALEFYKSYRQHANQRLKKEALNRNSALLWKSGSDFIWLRQRGAKVTILEGVNLNRNPALLAAAL
ncbi:MAG TPA: hypothetical protein VGB77_09565, partial [Abditibacteriaceae bacterium]